MQPLIPFSHLISHVLSASSRPANWFQWEHSIRLRQDSILRASQVIFNSALKEERSRGRVHPGLQKTLSFTQVHTYTQTHTLPPVLVSYAKTEGGLWHQPRRPPSQLTAICFHSYDICIYKNKPCGTLGTESCWVQAPRGVALILG